MAARQGPHRVEHFVALELAAEIHDVFIWRPSVNEQLKDEALPARDPTGVATRVDYDAPEPAFDPTLCRVESLEPSDRPLECVLGEIFCIPGVHGDQPPELVYPIGVGMTERVGGQRNLRHQFLGVVHRSRTPASFMPHL